MNNSNFIDYIKNAYKTGGVIIKILMINAFVFLFYILLIIIGKLFFIEQISSIFKWIFVLPGTFAELLYKPWTLVSNLFAHYSLGHFFWNMIMFYFTAKLFVPFFGEKRLLSTYIFGGVFGGLIHILSYLIFPFFSEQIPAEVVGASGAIAALIGALVYYQPHLKIKLFFMIEIPFWVFGVFFILSDLLYLTRADGIAHFVHLGGAVFGVLSVLKVNQSSNFMNTLDRWVSFNFSFKRQPKMKVYRNSDAKKMNDDFYRDNKAKKQKQVDAILDKISKHGYDSLSKKEKDFLFKYSNEK
ncbi:MAG TPA: rhomboid family intramembrane serine protease [Crocinitomix sp.]|nr:rhomboid family intramembrane serine protease [Crocinitomix sp.]